MEDDDIIREQRARGQRALVEFLQTDLNLAFTMLQAVELASRPEHRYSALGYVGHALHTIRILQGRIEDSESWNTIHDRAHELERALDSLGA
jgi:hypothetical protein